METQSKDQEARVSRRSLLRTAAVAAGGAAILGTAASRRAEAKAQQKLVGYQDTPHGAQQCDNCSQFVAPDSCKVVDGKISPTGWCKVYAKKPA